VVGKGSTFEVRLPVSSEQLAPGRGPELRAALPAGSGRVLVVDDEVTIGAAIRRVLGRSFQVEAFVSPRAALARLAGGERYDVVLCDLMMPEMSGAQFFAELQKLSTDQAAWVIFLTGGVFTSEMQQFLDGARRTLIEKPFDLEEVQAVVSRAVRDHRAQSAGTESRPAPA
jgi:CheY-like chemotaxis protein